MKNAGWIVGLLAILLAMCWLGTYKGPFQKGSG